jgi:hypothetical protein
VPIVLKRLLLPSPVNFATRTADHFSDLPTALAHPLSLTAEGKGHPSVVTNPGLRHTFYATSSQIVAATVLIIMTITVNLPPHSDEVKVSFPTERVLLLTLNRPQTLNAMTPQMEKDIKAVLNWFESEPSLWCVFVLLCE